MKQIAANLAEARAERGFGLDDAVAAERLDQGDVSAQIARYDEDLTRITELIDALEAKLLPVLDWRGVLVEAKLDALERVTLVPMAETLRTITDRLDAQGDRLYTLLQAISL